MTEREEFEGWYTSSGFVLGESTETYMWSAWQAARASRWRSMDSAPDRQDLRGWFGRYGAHACKTVDGVWHNDECVPYIKPQAWHPLPDPPTKEELEKLK